VYNRIISAVTRVESVSDRIKETPWSVSASELYRPSDRRLSAK
jgi:hypothetical protein